MLTLQTFNAIDVVKKRPWMFLKDGVFEPHGFCDLLREQALVLGAKEVSIFNMDHLFCITSDFR